MFEFTDKGITVVDVDGVRKLAERNTAKVPRCKKDTKIFSYGYCYSCGHCVYDRDNFCCKCGQKLKWD